MSPRAWVTLLALTALCLASARARAADAPSFGPLDVSALAASSERLYVGSFDAGLYVLEHGRALRAVSDPALSPHVNALAWSERDHVLWVGTARGLVRCPAGDRCSRVGPEGGVHAVTLASDGTLVAGGDAGLTFVASGGVRTFGKKAGAPFRSVWAIAEVGERLFVGTTSGLFWGAPAAFAGKHAELGRAAIVLNTLPDDWVTALDSRDGELYVGTYSAGIAEFRNEAALPVPVEVDPTLGYVNPDGLVALGPACIAVATMDGLRLGAPGRMRPLATRARDVTAFVSDPHGGFWIGTRAGLEFWNGACAAPDAPLTAR